MTGRLEAARRPPASTSGHEDGGAQRAAIYAVVRAIPPGKVATYGQVAELAGIARGHRVAAKWLRLCPAALPWHRVVGKRGPRRAQVSLHDPDHAADQRARLRAEGVVFDAGGLICLRRHGWLPLP